LTILPWILWIKIRKKESTDRLLFSGFIVLIISSWLDFMGSELGFWAYLVDVDPLSPSFVAYDFTLIPVSVMLLLQYKPNINPLLKAIVFSGVASFIFQPLLVWLGFYDPKIWKHYYSFPILIAIYLIADFSVKRKNFEKV
jgi:hypothetical protein